jgi:formyl-CoA transferase
VTLDLHKETGQKLLKELVKEADALIENFRPGTFESWGLGYEDLAAINPHLVMVRVTAFGQTGPYSSRPGFGTLAEAMSGFAHINGYPDGPPTLPPFALGDAVAALFGTSATMFALHYRDRQLDRPGQYVDLSIYEPLFWILGPQASIYDQLGVIQGRTGNRAPFTSPRNSYRSKDGRWIALSGSSQSIAERVMKMIGADYIIAEEWYRNHEGRLEHQDILDDLIGKWVAERSTEEVMETAEEAQVAMMPVYTIEDIFSDPQYLARETIISVDDPRIGPVKMQNVVPKLSKTPGSIRRIGPDLGEHNREVFLGELGHTEEEFAQWLTEGAI